MFYGSRTLAGGFGKSVQGDGRAKAALRKGFQFKTEPKGSM